jgi:hypothetical protein
VTASADAYASAEEANSSLSQPFNAIAGSIGSAVGASPDQRVNPLNTVEGESLNLLISALIIFIRLLILEFASNQTVCLEAHSGPRRLGHWRMVQDPPRGAGPHRLLGNAWLSGAHRCEI